ncbi:hypothetical protein BG261_02820 [Floricoccus tropicus]|uniref:HeH/LEM domain-containing protein n=1 Tax=Floricoccus tropicus TaxID=1859473 RepID=A0A1E8GMQ3_9LACT|nr:hypothetical protein [Floricoccus tropicus]OFI49529.1 hypothetical protein BG261_02820 [Floricoccus tropicus]
MRYINKKTNVIIDAVSQMLGDWVLVNDSVKSQIVETIESEEIPPIETTNEDSDAVKSESNDDDFDGITVAQIKQELTAQGIEFNPRAKKQELYDLMMG